MATTTTVFISSTNSGARGRFELQRYLLPLADAQDIFRTDDASLEKAHAQCLKCMAAFEGREPNAGQFVRDGFVFNKITGVYPYRTLCLSLTNHWRMDNDPPILHLHEFVERWNAKGYTPKLRLVTATQAMRHIEEEAGDNLDVVEGEWPDWWANGILATPRELAWARKAIACMKLRFPPTLGAMSEADQRSAARVERNLCLYGEHTFSNWKSIAEPYHFDSVAAEAEIRILAYRALDEAQGLLSDRLRRARSMDKPGVWVANTGDGPYRGWISLPRNSLRGAFTHLRDSESGALYRLEARPPAASTTASKQRIGGQRAQRNHGLPDQTPAFRVRFWVDNLPAQSLTCLQPATPPSRNAKTRCARTSAPMRRAGPSPFVMRDRRRRSSSPAWAISRASASTSSRRAGRCWKSSIRRRTRPKLRGTRRGCARPTRSTLRRSASNRRTTSASCRISTIPR